MCKNKTKQIRLVRFAIRISLQKGPICSRDEARNTMVFFVLISINGSCSHAKRVKKLLILQHTTGVYSTGEYTPRASTRYRRVHATGEYTPQASTCYSRITHRFWETRQREHDKNRLDLGGTRYTIR